MQRRKLGLRTRVSGGEKNSIYSVFSVYNSLVVLVLSGKFKFWRTSDMVMLGAPQGCPGSQHLGKLGKDEDPALSAIIQGRALQLIELPVLPL